MTSHLINDSDQIAITEYLRSHPDPSPTEMDEFTSSLIPTSVYNYQGRRDRVNRMFLPSVPLKDIVPGPDPKHIWFIRHAESEFNDWQSNLLLEGDASGLDRLVWDAKLTPKGIFQAQRLAGKIEKTIPTPDLIIVSPFTRATQTALIGLSPFLNEPERSDIPVIADPRVGEVLGDSGDVGTTVKYLRQQFPRVDYSKIGDDDIWWYHLPIDNTELDAVTDRLERVKRDWNRRRYREPDEHLEKRLQSFLEHILEIDPSYRNIVVVAHSLTIEKLTGRFIGNAEICETYVYP